MKSKNTVINLLLETLIKYKDEIRNIHSNHDIGNFQPEKNIKTAKSVETKEREIRSGEQLNMILNEGNHLNKTPSHKINHAEIGKKNHWIEISVQTIRHKKRVIPITEKGHSLEKTN